ncbi:MAG: ABC transporter ATP-binding protein [Victivallales bacterium]|nr:ABC transporter ATP-binding protein [Victivallales bacterium]
MELEVRNISGGYGGKRVVDDVSFRVPSGTVTTLVGANGSGKSTLLRLVAGILHPMAGCACLDGREVPSIPRRELARLMGVLPQQHHAPAELTVAELVAMGRFPHRQGWSPFASAADRRAVETALEVTRLAPLRGRSLASLSGGECQRAWLAMTLAREPKVLLLDEPTTFLDIGGQCEFLTLVRSLNHESRLTVLMVLHDLNVAATFSTQLVMLKEGRALCAGSPADTLTPATLRTAFGVEARILPTPGGIPHCLVTNSVKMR